ncbi:MAG: YgjV family protein [Alphaproteobacteria bacterium]|nr:YgjV family protein [Alphaproteobacteria bacterium]
MLLNELLDPNTVIYVLGLILALTSTQTKRRRKMMTIKFLAECFNSTYMILMGGLSGGLAGFIAAAGALTQALTPDRYFKKTVVPRIIGATILSAISLYISYKNPIDLLPITAVVACRYAELSSNTERIRLAYYLSGFPWILYLYLNGIYLMLATAVLMNIMLLIGLIRHYPRRGNIDPI